MQAIAHHYMTLMRLDKPVGIWLLFFPAAWAVLLSPNATLEMVVVMLIGAAYMRAAGCIINDMTDQTLDRQVTRTKHRPLAAGSVSRRLVLLVLFSLLGCSLVMALELPRSSVIVALIAIPLIAIYPRVKRVTYWPQLFLGVTFNLGVWIGWFSTEASFEVAVLPLYLACLFWTLAYDTIYAMQDMADDKRVGIKSTALYWDKKIPEFVTFNFAMMLMLLAVAGWLAGAGTYYYLGLTVAGLHMRWQIQQLRARGAKAAAELFESNQ